MIATTKPGTKPARVKTGSKGAKRKKKEKTLSQQLQALLAKSLLPDLKARAKQADIARLLRRQHAAEREGKLTSDRYEAWVERTVEQVGAAWVLSCVFIRTLEDRGLLHRRRLAGPGASDSEALFFQLAPSLSARDYLLAVFREAAKYPGIRDVMDVRHNPVWRLGPSAAGAQLLLDFFRELPVAAHPEPVEGRAHDGPNLRWTFAGKADTRFLGDLYQDLSENVRKRYALLQTPDFVESFILDQTLEPAIAQFGLENVRVIDPTCGSGHFLLGAYDRLFEHRLRAQPGLDPREHARLALDQVYGVDMNPYAVAIARFRLTLSYLEKAGFDKLARAPELHPHLVVADSLLHGKGGQTHLAEQPGLDEKAQKLFSGVIFSLDDPEAARTVFSQRYHVVVGNPPYITCKDKALREQYRSAYDSAAGKYALAAPFTERFFKLAEDGGYVGLINANSFMKREFGKALIEKVLPQWELSRVIDTSGAYIPGHGTPTVILFGRRQAPVSTVVPTVQGKRGEPQTPDDPEHGLVWSSIADHFEDIGFENDFISVAEVPRETFLKHPWSLGGGGASELKEYLEQKSDKRLGDIIDAIGVMALSGEDDVYIADSPAVFKRHGVADDAIVEFGIGENIRDWSMKSLAAIYPHNHDGSYKEVPSAEIFLWRYRTNLKNYIFFGKKKEERKLNWREFGAVQKDKLRTPLSIAFAFVATHNHFVLDRGGKVFNRSAPIIKLPETATEEDHLALLAYLNSSTACFWMKQVFSPKGMHNGSESNATPFLVRFEFDGTKLARLPVPPGLLTDSRPKFAHLGRTLADLQEQRHTLRFRSCDAFDSADDVDRAFSQLREKRRALLEQSVSIQEEIDWLVYEAFGLVNFGLDVTPEPLALGERPFEIHLGRVDGESVQTGWFRWNETKPATVVPDRLSSETKFVLQARIDQIAENKNLSLLEGPVCKRRWVQPAGKGAGGLQTDVAMIGDDAQAWLEEQCEALIASTTIATMSLRSLLRDAEKKPSLMALATWIAEPGPQSGNEYVEEVIRKNAVPAMTAAIYTDSGLEKRSLWEETWALQRQEDAGKKTPEIPVPPKYAQKDFREDSFWKLRGKLDVPKERFISYPGCESDENPSPVIGWAGWNHLQRAQALVALYQDRKNVEGWEASRLIPMLAGLLELIPWLKQWHNEPDPEFDDQRLGDTFEEFLEGQLSELSLTKDALRAWRPPKAARKKRTKKSS